MTNKNMTDRLTSLYELSGVYLFNDGIKGLIIEVINELYAANCDLIFRLRLNHIDRAIFKFRQAKEKRCIRNTKQYFKACIISAINETEIDEL